MVSVLLAFEASFMD